MPLWLPPALYAEQQTNFPATPSITGGTNVVSGAANTKGSWVSLIDPVDDDSHLLHLQVLDTAISAGRGDVLLDIGIGPTGGGSEQVILPDLLVGWASTLDHGGKRYRVPIDVPKGVRLSGRSQGNNAADVVRTTVVLYCNSNDGMGAWPRFKRADAIGVSTASSQGTAITSGSTGVEGSWTNVGSTTARAYDGLLFQVGGTTAVVAMTQLAYHFEVGYSSGVPILGEFMFAGNASEFEGGGLWPNEPIYAKIPSGTQLQVRGECQTAAPLAFDVALYGLY